MAITERDTCRKYVLPKLQAAGWEADPRPIQEEKTFTDGYTRDFMIAVVEAKAAYRTARHGLQQAKDYAVSDKPLQRTIIEMAAQSHELVIDASLLQAEVNEMPRMLLAQLYAGEL
jgi:hypothetical protein